MPEKTFTLDVPGAVLTYDVREPEAPSHHPPLFVFGSPMAASGFVQLVDQLDDRTVITYDPHSPGAVAYLAVAKEVAERGAGPVPLEAL